MSTEEPRINHETLYADKVQFSVGRYISDYEAYKIRGGEKALEAFRDEVVRGLCVQLVAYFAGVPKERISIHKRWPQTWWDAFKERWFPAWLLSRWPAEYETLDIEKTVTHSICPHVQIPREGAHLQWLLQQSREPVSVITYQSESDEPD